MNAYLARLFKLQTAILSNYVLNELITFFMDPNQKSIFLYETIIITRDVTKKEMEKIEKKPPTTQKYLVFAEKSGNKLIFTLRLDGFSDVEFYNVVLNNEPPTVHSLKTIVEIIVSRCRPIPTKVDSKFSNLAIKYSDYLEQYQIKRTWQNGYFPKYNHFNKRTGSKKIENSLYEEFILETTHLLNTYRAFSKILIDIYQGKTPVRHLSENKIFLLDVSYSKQYGISLELDNSREQQYTHEVIHLAEFAPDDPFFKNKYDFVKGMTSAVYPSLNIKK